MATTVRVNRNYSGYVSKTITSGGSTSYSGGEAAQNIRYTRNVGAPPSFYESVGIVWFPAVTGTDYSGLTDAVTYYRLSFNVRVTPVITISPVGTGFAGLKTSVARNVSDKPTLYNAIKDSTPTYVTTEEKAASVDIIFPLTDLTDILRIHDNGLGIVDTNTDSIGEYQIAYYSPYYEYVYALRSIPTPSYPSAETIVVNEDVTFTWDYTQPSEVQTHYDLDISTNGITWTNYANKVESADHECVIAAGTLTSRTYYWRVRTWSESGTVPSLYQQASFIAVVNPETTDITCDGMPMPTIGWAASEQQAFQIKFGNYDTGTIYSAIGSYKIPYYFDDGAYVVTVRTQNNLGVWSAWTDPVGFAVENVPGDDIALAAEQSGNAVNLMWTTAGTYEKYYIYRDNVPIAETDDVAYADNFAYGTSVYKVRGVLANDYYTMSSEETVALVLTCDMVSDVDTVSWLKLEYSLGSPVSRTYNKSDDVTYLRFAGREYPVSAHSGFKNRRGNFNYAFKTRAEIEALMDLSGSTVIHKDTKGNRTIGIINDFSPVYTGKFYYAVSFNITQTDYNEAVAYD